MYLTARESLAHAVGRVVLVFSFGTCFVYLGYSTVKILDELREVLLDGARAAEFHTVSFVACVCAMMAWITDSVHCDFWQNLPFGLPYPQLHAMVWHNLMLIAVLCVVLLQVQHRQDRQ